MLKPPDCEIHDSLLATRVGGAGTCGRRLVRAMACHKRPLMITMQATISTTGRDNSTGRVGVWVSHEPEPGAGFGRERLSTTPGR
jgi:hypothetical protein